MNKLSYIFILLVIFIPLKVTAHIYELPKNTKIIGKNNYYMAKDNESLIEIARQFGLGYNEIVDANPNINPFLPGPKSPVKIPTSWILPNVDKYEGIVINLSELRLYYFFKEKDKDMVATFPVGIGDEGKDTPLGIFSIIEKKENPSWYVPESIKREKPYLPKIVPPGPKNPLGSHALRLSLSSYLIHGTNKPWAVGRKVTNGCIRLYPEHIQRLYNLVPIGTKVTIVRQPIKVGIKDSKVFVEVHNDNYNRNINYLNEAIKVLSEKRFISKINTEKLYLAVKEKTGIPVEISD